MKYEGLIGTAIVLILLTVTPAFCSSSPFYEATVAFVKDTMASGTSLFRNESYQYINIDKCELAYSVSGTFPVGGTYTFTFNNLKLYDLDPEQTKVSHDYTSFLILHFDDYVEWQAKYEYKAVDESLKIRTVVINVSDDEAAQRLLKAFLHLGELCRARQACY